MALVNGGFLHYTDMKKFLKNLFLRSHWSDFEINLQKSGFYISRHPDCPIRALIATGKVPSSFVSPLGKLNFGLLLSIQVIIADTGIFEI